MIEIIPAVDLKNGRCVRLLQGRMEEETLYYEDPVDAARLWYEQGARRIHVVDLDGAVTGKPQNLKSLERIVQSVPLPIQVGGGIRGRLQIQKYLDLGVDRVILGTLACQSPGQVKELSDEYPGRILLGIDARDGYVAIKGWKDTTGVLSVDLLRSYGNLPVAGVIYTDIQRDGMLSGPNIQALRSILSQSPFPVIASGGITTCEDLKALSLLEPIGLTAAIIGKALYAGRLTFESACSAVSGELADRS
jgi:phosphoribosylformimino-5-aminoimidazole carboxamide ribotide isomerase